MSSTELDPRVTRVLDALDDHDADTAAAQFTAAGQYFETPRDEEFSRSEFRDYLVDLFETFPDYRIVERQVYTTDEWATTLHWSFRGTHEGSAGWFEPTGNTVTLPVVSVVTLVSDGITAWRDFFDIDAITEQLHSDPEGRT